ncbi:MAG: hypothetical protein RIC19_17775 [Phaeodactylibacter sp.]|uniref:hypothetical protein n=1 Tax=Phaeodactylibacter sp. TaxID=1940289 RepID=UPI0032EB820F
MEKIKAGLVVLLVVLVSQLDAQVFRYGIQAGIGIEQFSNGEAVTRQDFEVPFRPLLSAGGLAEVSFREVPVFFELGLNFNHSHRIYRRGVDSELAFGLTRFEEYRDRKAYFLTLPISAGFREGRVSVSFGMRLLYTLATDNRNSTITYYYILSTPPQTYSLYEIDYEPFHTEPFVKASYALTGGWEAYGAIFRHSSNPDFESIHARWRYVVGVVYYLEGQKN